MAKTAKDAAQWMYEEIKKEGILYQEYAVGKIAELFGEEFTYYNDNGNLAISKEVLKEFKKLHGGNAFWDRSDFSWSWEG
jgi:hypothetical protein